MHNPVLLYPWLPQVEATYPELVELLLVVIKTLLDREPQFTIDRGVYVCLNFYMHWRHAERFYGQLLICMFIFIHRYSIQHHTIVQTVRS